MRSLEDEIINLRRECLKLERELEDEKAEKASKNYVSLSDRLDGWAQALSSQRTTQNWKLKKQ